MEFTSYVRLTVFQPGLAPQNLALPGGVITLGRANDCTVPIKDRFLSRRHAEIVHDDDDGWLLRDCGSVNGTLLNGLRVVDPQPLRPGDRIGLGDSEVVFNAAADDTTSHIVAVESSSHATNMTIAVDVDERGSDRTQILNALAVEFLADRPMAELFDFILDRVNDLLEPSRVGIATLGRGRMQFENVTLSSRRSCASAARCCRRSWRDARSCRSSTAPATSVLRTPTRSSPSRSAPRSARRWWSATTSSACSISTSSAAPAR